MKLIHIESDDLYLYTIIKNNRVVSGIVCCLSLHKLSHLHLHQHEFVSQHKVSALYHDMIFKQSQCRPLMVGTVNNVDFKRCLPVWQQSPSSQITISDELHLIRQLRGDAAKCVRDFFASEQHLILLDGHHRYAALNALNQTEITTMCWLVPTTSLEIKTFAKVLTVHDEIKLANMIATYHSPSKYHPPDFMIYFDKKIYRANHPSHSKSPFSASDAFITELIESHIASCIEYHPCANCDDLLNIMQQVNDNKMLISTTSLCENDFIQAIKREKTLPIHTTCFEPKPTENHFIHQFNQLSQRGIYAKESRPHLSWPGLTTNRYVEGNIT